MIVTKEMKSALNSRLMELIDAALTEGSDIHTAFKNHVRITYRSRMGTTAAYAYLDTLVIQFNTTLVARNFDTYLNETLPHELAHLIVHHTYGEVEDGHGEEFQHVCELLGCVARYCAPMDGLLEAMVKTDPKRGYHVYECACANAIFSDFFRNKMTKKKIRMVCNECDCVLQYTGQSYEPK